MSSADLAAKPIATTPPFSRFVRKFLRAVLRYDPAFCDMHDDPRARAAAAEYLQHIQRHVREAFGGRRLDILDAGCQAGRLLIPLAEQGHRVVGIDTSGMALSAARRHARERRLSVRLHRGDIGQLRRWVRPRSFDVVICTEVLYLCRDHEAILRAFAESLRPGGLLCVSHRSQAYYAGISLLEGKSEMAREMLAREDGPSPQADYHNWQTPEQLRRRYEALGLTVLECAPVDHQMVSINPPVPADVRDALRPFSDGESAYRIPSYLLMAARVRDAG
jgi:2-polyprenyl-3-methyl-5-hydroxy-6-metoxy-1,4-benzoquinol methylase